jgi:bifunctional enzyme CysN/CysC
MQSTQVERLRDSGRPKDLLRFITCGSVDDGKSTLIGRLLHDSKLIYDDQLSSLVSDSARHGTTGDDIDFALLVDGLEAEREQGITIDVAYRFFATANRSFIVADTPGHEQYTRNMATGASNAQLAIILIDARKGALVQTRRHSLICSLLGIRHVVIAVNKIDLVDYQREVFERIVNEYTSYAAQLGFASVMPIPISARFGDNVISRSDRTPWYSQAVLLQYLETIDIGSKTAAGPLRFPVQWVNRPTSDFRGYAGTVVSGNVEVGDPVVVATSGQTSSIKEIVTFDGPRASAEAGDAVTLTLATEVDLARGDILVSPSSRPEVSDQFAAHLIWMSENPMVPGRKYLGRIGNRTVPTTITALKYKVDPNTGKHLAAHTLALNDLAFCNVATSSPIAFDAYDQNRQTGSFIIIDRFTNQTVGAGMVAFGLRRGTNIAWQPLLIAKSERAAIKHQKPAVLWLTGFSGAGKSTIANLLERRLYAAGHHTMLLDGDNIRHGLCRDLGFTEADRVENIRRVGEVAKLMTECGLVVICAFISPYRAEREMVRDLFTTEEFIEVFVDTPIAECIRRDPKGLYAKVKAGQLRNFTGIDAPYEAPLSPEIHLHTMDHSPEQVAESLFITLVDRAIIVPIPVQKNNML